MFGVICYCLWIVVWIRGNEFLVCLSDFIGVFYLMRKLDRVGVYWIVSIAFWKITCDFFRIFLCDFFIKRILFNFIYFLKRVKSYLIVFNFL